MARSRYSRYAPTRKKRGNTRRVVLLLFLFIAGAVIGLGALRGASSPQIQMELSGTSIGQRGQVKVMFQEPGRGLAGVKVEVLQGDVTKVLCQSTFVPRAAHKLWGEVTGEHRCDAEIGKQAIPALEEGPLEVRATAQRAGNWFWTPDPVVERRNVQMKLQPPSIAVTSDKIYVSQGGAEVVVYNVGADAVHHGVEIGDWFFPGYALPGGNPNQAFALFAVPYNVDTVASLKIIAEDKLGNRGESSGFVHQFFPHAQTTDTIGLSDGFMAKVVGEILPRVGSLKDKGDLLQNYLQLNRDLRKLNRAQLRKLADQTTPRFLWSEPFVPMKNAAVKGVFADDRTYKYQGQAVDRQTHLGIDFASVAQAPIEAANNGRVLVADYMGIYGNCVVIDHGYGLMSLYGHLTTIGVKKDQEVQRGQQIGTSGASGMAGGDHLHFAFLLHGLPTDPKEWWDENWLSDRLKLKLGDALPYAGEAN